MITLDRSIVRYSRVRGRRIEIFENEDSSIRERRIEISG
jgi:hypothetical protein